LEDVFEESNNSNDNELKYYNLVLKKSINRILTYKATTLGSTKPIHVIIILKLIVNIIILGLLIIVLQLCWLMQRVIRIQTLLFTQIIIVELAMAMYRCNVKTILLIIPITQCEWMLNELAGRTIVGTFFLINGLFDERFRQQAVLQAYNEISSNISSENEINDLATILLSGYVIAQKVKRTTQINFTMLPNAAEINNKLEEYVIAYADHPHIMDAVQAWMTYIRGYGSARNIPAGVEGLLSALLTTNRFGLDGQLFVISDTRLREWQVAKNISAGVNPYIAELWVSRSDDYRYGLNIGKYEPMLHRVPMFEWIIGDTQEHTIPKLASKDKWGKHMLLDLITRNIVKRKGQKYIAITHVWSQRLVVENGQPSTKFIAMLLTLHQKGTIPRYVWIDVHCISKNPVLRAATMAELKVIYREAESVLIVDRGLLLKQYTLSEIWAIDWSSRAWTLCEAYNAKKLLVMILSEDMITPKVEKIIQFSWYRYNSNWLSKLICGDYSLAVLGLNIINSTNILESAAHALIIRRCSVQKDFGIIYANIIGVCDAGLTNSEDPYATALMRIVKVPSSVCFTIGPRSKQLNNCWAPSGLRMDSQIVYLDSAKGHEFLITRDGQLIIERYMIATGSEVVKAEGDYINSEIAFFNKYTKEDYISALWNGWQILVPSYVNLSDVDVIVPCIQKNGKVTSVHVLCWMCQRMCNTQLHVLSTGKLLVQLGKLLPLIEKSEKVGF
jgi:hypothetical protein